MIKRYLSFILAGVVVLGTIVLGSFAAVLQDDGSFASTGDPTADYILSYMHSENSGISLMSLGPDTLSYNGNYGCRFYYREAGYTGSSSDYVNRSGSNIYPTASSDIYGVLTSTYSNNDYNDVAYGIGLFNSTSSNYYCDFYISDLQILDKDYRISGSFTSSFLMKSSTSTSSTSAFPPVDCQLLVNGQVYDSVAFELNGQTVTVPDTIISRSVFTNIDSIGFRLHYWNSVTNAKRELSVGSVQGLYSFNLANLAYQIIEPPTPVPLPDEQYNGLISAINGVKDSVSQQSPMDKFESDYIQNFDNQLTKTEEYIGSDSPVIPGNFVTSGSDGSPSMVDSLKDGMGLSNSSFDSQAFQDASQAFSGPDSTSEGGMWWFFTQEIADALEATNSNSREGDTVDSWISDSDRRWSIWGW
uniref:Uncharacterized protein n=1 Tax=uncultured prokaryote TaxID=198431 RepID=A0A0H5PYN5_9ZZZZ|nr:hypothetical protein [uncultured prokaryote]